MTLPLHSEKHAEPPLFTAAESWEYFGEGEPLDVPANVVLCYQDHLFEQVANRPDADPIDGLFPEVVVLDEPDAPVGVAGGFGVGAPATAMAMEELHHHGANRFLSVGFAGTLRPDVAVGDFVLPTEALRDEGTSHHYVEPAETIRPAESLVADLRAYLTAREVEYHEGTSWTIDAIYRETPAEVERYRDRGVVTVEMELAATLAVADYHGIAAGGLFAVSDRLGDEWERGFEDASERLEEALEYGVGTLTA